MSKRESYIEKSIDILINTGDYENIRVGAKIGETIDWETPEERAKKIASVREDLKRQIASDVNDILDSFELNHKANAKKTNALRTNSDDIEIDDDSDFDL